MYNHTRKRWSRIALFVVADRFVSGKQRVEYYRRQYVRGAERRQEAGRKAGRALLTFVWLCMCTNQAATTLLHSCRSRAIGSREASRKNCI